VRDQAREVVALVVFSAVTSCALAGALMVVVHLGGRG
jgi:hypothetical protein